MRRMSIDTIFTLRMQYRVGQLARIATAIAEAGGLVGEIVIRRVGDEHTIRDITVETADDPHTVAVAAKIAAIDGVEILEQKDGVFDRHKGGKLHMSSRIPLRDISDLRYAKRA